MLPTDIFMSWVMYTHLSNPLLQALHLLHDPPVKSPLYHQLNVFVLVLLSHRNVCSPWFQLMCSKLPECILFNSKCEVQRFRVILLNPQQTAVECWFQGLQVLQRSWSGKYRTSVNLAVSLV